MIAVIGAGSWGTALALLLARNGIPTRLWGNEPDQQSIMQQQRRNARYLPDHPFPDCLTVPTTLPEAVAEVRDICLVVPSHAFRAVCEELRPLVADDVRLVWGTKGLDPKKKCVLSEVVAEVFGSQQAMAVLAGPSFAKEVADQKPTAVSMAGNDAAFVQNCVDYFHSDRFRIYVNQDLVGVQLCGALKNILAIAVGIADGLQLGANTRSALITRGLAEMARFNEALGGDRLTLMSLAGVGDLVLTATDDQSRNRRFGLAIGQGHRLADAKQAIGQEIEGATNTRQVFQLAQELQVDMPITRQVYAILHQGASPQQVVAELLERAPKQE